MRTIELDGNQRLRLEFLLGSQKGTVAEMRRLDRILTKLELSEAQRAQIGLAEQGALYRWNPSVLESFPPLSISLEDSEVDAILKIIRDCRDFTRTDIRTWVDKTMQDLEKKDG